jgi:hypothetical protein
LTVRHQADVTSRRGGDAITPQLRAEPHVPLTAGRIVSPPRSASTALRPARRLLLIASGNASLSGANPRARELRCACLGAEARRLIRQLLVEPAARSLAAASWGWDRGVRPRSCGLLRTTASLIDTGLDGACWAATGMSLMTGLACGLLPAPARVRSESLAAVRRGRTGQPPDARRPRPRREDGVLYRRRGPLREAARAETSS